MGGNLFSAAEAFQHQIIYYPQKRPGYCGWTSFFPFSGDCWGLAFNEVCPASNPKRAKITLEEYEAEYMPYSYQDVMYPFATGKYKNEYVYMLSEDRGRTWRETARVPAHTRHYWHVGFEDKSMVRVYALGPGDGEAFGVYSDISYDLGQTWERQSCLLNDYFTFIHRFRRLSNGWVVACGPIFEKFGPGHTRRGRHDVSADVITNVQTCFFYSKDRGKTWSPPHYILPGIQAWEPDFIDLGGGSMLFINSDVQHARSVRQVVHNTRFGYVNEPLCAIFRGAESVGAEGSRKGYVPESIAQTAGGLLIGARRQEPYAVSSDMGANWHLIDAPPCEYQPFLELMPDGEVVTLWHYGGDSPFGQKDMHIGMHRFYLRQDLPKPVKIHAERMLSADGACYENRYLFRLTSADKPLPGQPLTVRYALCWNEDGTYNTKPLSEAATLINLVTDERGEAVADLGVLEKTADIFKAYSVDCVFRGVEDYSAARSDCLFSHVMTPRRGTADRYDFYLVNGTLVIAPAAARAYPFIPGAFAALVYENGLFTQKAWQAACGGHARAAEALDALIAAYVVERAGDGVYRCGSSTHQVSECIRECRVFGNDVVLV